MVGDRDGTGGEGTAGARSGGQVGRRGGQVGQPVGPSARTGGLGSRGSWQGQAGRGATSWSGAGGGREAAGPFSTRRGSSRGPGSDSRSRATTSWSGWGGRRPPVGTAVGPEERSVGGRTATEGRGAGRGVGRPPSRTRLGGGPAVPLREVETMNKIYPDHPHSPTPSLATVPKVNKNALFPTIFTSRDQLVRPRRPAAPPFPGPPTRPRWLLYHPNRPLGPARTGAGTARQGRGGTWRGTGRGTGRRGRRRGRPADHPRRRRRGGPRTGGRRR